MARIKIKVPPGECLCVGYMWVCDKDRNGEIIVELQEQFGELVTIRSFEFRQPEEQPIDEDSPDENDGPRLVPPFQVPTFGSAEGRSFLAVVEDSALTEDLLPIKPEGDLTVEDGAIRESPNINFKDTSDLPGRKVIDIDELPNFSGKIEVGPFWTFNDTPDLRDARILEFFNQVNNPEEIVDRIRDNPDIGSGSSRRYGIKADTAARVIAERKRKPGGIFRGVGEINAVSGIGPNTWEDILYSFQEVGGQRDSDEETEMEETGPFAVLDELHRMLLGFVAYTQFANDFGLSKRPPPRLIADISPVLEQIVKLEEEGPESTGYGEVTELVLDLAAIVGTAYTEKLETGYRFSDIPSLFPAQPAFPVGIHPIMGTTILASRGPVPSPQPPFPFDSMGQWNTFLNHLERNLATAWRGLPRSTARRLSIRYRELLAAIAAARQFGTTSQLAAALRAFIQHAIRMGVGNRFLAVIAQALARIGGSLGGAGGAAAGGGAAGGFVLVDVLLLIILLILWAIMWVKIGNWLWNQEIPGNGETYVEYYANVAYQLLYSNDCDKLLSLVTSSSRRVRELEREGVTGDRLQTAAALGAAAISKYLSKCDTNIRSTLERRLKHYGKILQR
ncbi:hypothetical protein D3OALGA1CA_3820 [Olavius algarvensis associated proteobacterium Delta 3]|nr:hypothetical protein D3OALGA1CA_3820 [Olavius algarvensis associated proteobacterium Delta 3]CAB5150550.1 hypothetical protein D3OALGB2SA_4778 [Olavius algarvensis associated proteobacterium Delta 3]